MPRATLTSKGQLTVPKQLRERLGLEAGDRIDFTVDEVGRLIGEPVEDDPLEEVIGSLHHLAKPRTVSLEDMERAIQERHGRTSD